MLLRLFLNKLAAFFKFSTNPIPWLVSVLLETETGQSTGQSTVLRLLCLIIVSITLYIVVLYYVSYKFIRRVMVHRLLLHTP